MSEVEESDELELENGLKFERSPSHIGEDTIPFESEEVSYNAFFKKYLCRNRPCILQITTKNWESVNKWILDKKPNFTYISKKFGSASVPIANCDEKYYNVQKKSDSQLSDYLNYWQDYIQKCHADLPCLYLKDWHFTRDFPDENIYRVPKYFASDWLNEYFSRARKGVKDDYRFVYMGPKGSWTPLHADVFTSFSWSINICGRKRWLLFPKGEENCLRDKFGQLAYDVTASEMKDENMYPAYKNLKLSVEVIQEAGEAIFVPSGWHHQVWNLDDTISINHNWVNGCNIDTMWTSLQENLKAVKKEVEDCRDMEDWNEHCQLMLQATFGISYEEFYYFLYFIGRIRLESLETTSPLILYGDWKLTRNHIIFDLRQLMEVFTSFITDSDVINLTFYKTLGNTPEEFIKKMYSYIS